MYQTLDTPRTAPRVVESPALLAAEAAVRQALGRVRKALTAWLPGMLFDPAALAAALAGPLDDPAQERERLFALGWLRWLAADPAAAWPLLDEALAHAGRLNDTAAVAESAYWRARV